MSVKDWISVIAGLAAIAGMAWFIIAMRADSASYRKKHEEQDKENDKRLEAIRDMRRNEHVAQMKVLEQQLIYWTEANDANEAKRVQKQMDKLRGEA